MIALYPLFKDIIDVSFLPVNILFTIGLLICVVYWFFAILGVLDFDFLDFDLDLDIDTDVDVDSSFEVDAGGGGVVIALLKWLNIDSLPFTVFLSFFFLIGWTLSVLLNQYIGQNQLAFGILLFVPILFMTSIITKVLTTPFIPFFKSLNDVAKSLKIVGKECEIIYEFDRGETSQAKMKFDEDVILITVELAESAKVETVRKGELVNVYSKRMMGENAIYQVG